MTDNPILTAYQEAFAVITTADAHFGEDGAHLALLRDTALMLEGKTKDQVVAMVMSLAQTSAGLLHLLERETGVPSERLLQEVATMNAQLVEEERESGEE